MYASALIILLDRFTCPFRGMDVRGKDGNMPMVGHRYLTDNQDIVDPTADVEIFDHRVIIFLVPAEQDGLHSLQADMERVYFAEGSVRQLARYNPAEAHDS